MAIPVEMKALLQTNDGYAPKPSGSALEAMIPQLRALGHDQVAARGLPLKTNGAQRTAAGWVGAADPRSEGAAVRE